ncbi:phage portal protein, partial [Listeria monocytogenes]|nr:phage portal protein [Listeria monocytogenes]
NATQIDKIVSSGTFLRDEVREVTDYDPLPNGEGQQLIMTKNYEKVTKGGENENAES